MNAPSIKFRLVTDGGAQVKADLAGVESQVDRLAGAVSRIGHYGAGFLLLDQGIAPLIGHAVRAADTVTTLHNTLKLATSSAREAGLAYDALFQIAQRSRVGFAELGATYASISRAGQEMGISQQRLLAVTEAIGNAMTISGGSAQGMQAALTQLAQGLASGTLRGEELNSVMEQAPRLAKALADGLGVPIGRMREMGAAGEITAQQVINALESQSQVLSGEVTGATITVSQAFTTLQNAAIKAVGDFDSATGASSKLAGAVTTVAENVAALGKTVRDNEDTVSIVFGAAAGVAAAAGIAGVAAAVGKVSLAVYGLGAALTANPLTLTLLGLTAAAGAGVAALRTQSRTADGIAAAIKQLEDENRRSEEAMERAMGAGRAAGVDTIRKTIDDRKKAIAELRAEATLLQTKGLDTSAEEARLTRLSAAAKTAARDQEDLNRLRSKLSGVPEGYVKDMNEIIRLNQAGVLVGKEYTDVLRKQQDALLKKAGTAKAASQTLKDEWSIQVVRTYTSALGDLTRVQDQASAKAEELSASQAVLKRVMGGPEWAAFSRQQQEQIIYEASLAQAAEDSAAAQKSAAKAVEEAQKSAAKAIEEAKKSHDDLVGSLVKSADSTEAYALQLENEEQAADLAMTANLSLAVALQHVAIARLREKQLAMLGNEDAVLAIQREIDARERLILLIGSKEVRESNQKAAKDAAKAWDDSVEQMSKGLADALLRGGKSGRQYIEDQLRRPFAILIQAMVQPTIAGIGGWLGLPGVGSPLGGAPGAGSGMAGLGMLGTSSIAMGFSGAWGAGGGLMSTLNAGASLLGSGAIGSGLGVMAGALGPLALGAMLLAGLDDSGTLHTGAAASSDGTRARSISAPSLGTQGIVTSRQSQTAMNQIATGGAGALNATAKAFGLQGGYTVSTAYADDSSGDGAWGAMSISRAGQVRQDWRDGQTSRWAPRVFSDGQAGQQEYEGAVADTLLDELNAMGLPDWAMGILEDLGDAPEMQDLVEAVSQINELQTVLGALGHSMVDFSAFSEEALISLVSATGGGAALLGQLSSYEAKYYTTAEKRAALEAQLGSELAKVNLQMPRTRQEYRAMMDAALAMGDAGAPTVQVLLANADAFATLTPEIEEATEAVTRSAADIARERDGLQRRYLQVMGDTQALRQLELAQLDESNRALQQQIWAEEDRQATVAAAAKAQEDYNRALQTASSFLDGVTRSIRDFVKGGVGSNTLADDPATAMSVYRDQYRRAAAGDRDALQSITTAAGRVVSAAEQRMSASDGRRLIAQVSEELLALPGMLTPEQFIADAVTTSGGQTTAAVQLLPEQLDATIGARLSAGFDRIDANSDRQISRAEFLSAFAMLGTEQTLNSIFAKLDTNGDGQLSELEAIRNNALVSNDWLAIIRGDLAHIANLVFDLHYYQRHDLAHLTNVMQAGLTVRSEYRAGVLQTFAVGGAFGPGGVVQRPVAFPIGLMGEAGPEAILPLTRIGGTLGVRAVGGASSSDRLEPLLRELVAETARQGYELRAVVTSNNAIARRMREVELRGVMVRPAPDEPLAVEAV